MQELRPIEHPQSSELLAMRPVCHIPWSPFKCALLIGLHNSVDSRKKLVFVPVLDKKLPETDKPVQSLRNVEGKIGPACLQLTRFQNNVLDFVEIESTQLEKLTLSAFWPPQGGSTFLSDSSPS